MIIRSFLMLLLLFPVAGFSQSSKVTSGVVNYNNQEYALAIENFTTALENKSSLEEKHLFKAWYYCGKSYVAQLSEDLSSGDVDRINEHYDNILKAYDCYKNAYTVTGSDSDKRKVDSEVKLLIFSMLQLGIAEMNANNHEKAQDYFNNCKDADERVDYKDSYTIYDLSGQNYLYMRDSTKSLNDLNKAIELYESGKPARPDFLIGYTYYRVGFIHYLRGEKAEKILEPVQAGIEMMESENQRRLKLISESSDENEKSILREQEATYEEVLLNLQTLELDVYLNYAGMYDEALTKFKKAVDNNPENETILLAYGNLLEQKDPDGGYEIYKRVLNINPDNSTALYNAGANRVNKGYEYARLSNEEQDFKRIQEYEAKMKEYMKEALPYFERNHELNPNDRGTLDALVQITITLEMNEEYQKYKGKLRSLNGY